MANRNRSDDSRQGDYWCVDRKGRKRFTRLGRGVLVAMALLVTVLVASCANTNQTFAQQYEAAYGNDGQTRNTSDVLSPSLSAVAVPTLGLLSSQKWFIDCGVVPVADAACPCTAKFDGRALSISSGSSQIDKVVVYFTDRSKLDFSLKTSSFSYRLPAGRQLDGLLVRLRNDGSKWYFDSGKWFVDADSARWYGDCDSSRWYGDVDNAQGNQNQNGQ